MVSGGVVEERDTNAGWAPVSFHKENTVGLCAPRRKSVYGFITTMINPYRPGIEK